MATLESEVKLRRIDLKTASSTNYYQSHNPERWQEVKNVLSAFDIFLTSDYQVDFHNESYRLQAVPGHFGARDAKIFYQDTMIAKAYVIGNPGDREARFIVYLNDLKKVYPTKQAS